MPSRLEDLELLVAVIDHGSFSAAAATVGTSQSRVSRAIARLERGLGLALVRRSPREVSPTDAGHRLAAQARRMAAELAAVEQELRGDDGMTGRIALSTPPSLGRRLLAPALAAFCRAHPGVQLDWSLGARKVDLIAEQVDVAVRFGPLAPTWARARRLLAGSYHLYAAPGIAERVNLPSELSQVPCLGIRASQRRDRWAFVVDGQTRWYDADPVHWTDDVDALIAMAVGGLGVAPLPDFLVAREVDAGQLVRLTKPAQATPSEVFANLGFQQPTARASALVAHLAEALAEWTGTVAE